jgi:hypothetical protein
MGHAISRKRAGGVEQQWTRSVTGHVEEITEAKDDGEETNIRRVAPDVPAFGISHVVVKFVGPKAMADTDIRDRSLQHRIIKRKPAERRLMLSNNVSCPQVVIPADELGDEEAGLIVCYEVAFNLAGGS